MATGISLANKSQLLFGFAVVLILGTALAVPWIWSASMVIDSQREIMRQLADAWLRDQIQLGRVRGAGIPPAFTTALEIEPVRMAFVSMSELELSETDNEFVTRAASHFDENSESREYFEQQEVENEDVYHFARTIRESEMRRIRDQRLAEFPPTAADPAVADRTRGLLIIDRRSEFAGRQLLITRMYLIAAWLFCSLLAILVSYFILTKLILSPVRSLRETAEKIEAGDTTIRANIKTGDEFEQLSSAFNSMLERMTESQRQLRSMNETLDLRLGELAEANFALFESNRLKGEFLAAVSHELKTPLNVIIGFSELLNEMATTEQDADPKRARYIDNILSSSRSLLEMITDLLEMAKIEAGRAELSIETTSLDDLVEGLTRLMKAEADRREVTIATRVDRGIPTIETDAGKLQQVLYNFLSNALKFTPPGGSVTLAIERQTDQTTTTGVRMSVTDTGPGVPLDMQDLIFEKFRQVDASHTREHRGVGLGLAICRELAGLLGGEVGLVSTPGEGAMFYVDLPLRYETPQAQPLMADDLMASPDQAG